jgi:hypothetical protein
MARIKKKEHEKLSTSNVQHVADLLAAEKPITKKEACAILSISYNTTRLAKILNDHEENKAYKEERKNRNKGKAASDYEIKEAATMYLKGSNVTDIAQSLYRSAGFVKAILERLGVPTKPSSVEERMRIAYLPENCVSEEFEAGELAWSAKYHAIVEVQYELTPEYAKTKKGLGSTNYVEKYGSRCYATSVRDSTDDLGNPQGFFAFDLAQDLGRLKHLEKYGVNLATI